MTQSTRITAWLIASCLTLIFCLLTGFISGWGWWYSPDTVYAQQIDAFFRGELAVSPSPAGVGFDMAWGPNGAQQVWGLAVPAWRLPFEVLARLFGQKVFSDRIPFAVLYCLVAYFVIKAFVLPVEGTTTKPLLRHLNGNPGYPIVAFVLMFFPPIFPLVSGSFVVYDQPRAYGYLCSIGLLAGTIQFARKPQFSTYLILSALAGLIGFVRPTMLAYGGATLTVCAFTAFLSGWRLARLSSGPILFGLGMSILFLTNNHRFGSGFEFGHRLNMTGMDMMLFSRFQGPFDKEPIWSAAKELIGLLFFVRNHSDMRTLYNDGLVAFQSQTPRLRWMHSQTFNFLYLSSLIGSAAWLCWKLPRLRKNGFVTDRDLLVISAWGLLSAVAMGIFYLRFFAVGSRYMLDFSGAIAAVIAFSIAGLFRIARLRAHIWPSIVLFVCLAGWWVTEVDYLLSIDSNTGPVIQAQALPRLETPKETDFSIPSHYAIGAVPRSLELETGIDQNGVGWDIESGQTQSVVALYIENPTKLQIEVAPSSGIQLSDEEFASIRARIGLELLGLESITPTDSGQLLTFRSPEKKTYQTGVQVAFLCFAPPGEYLLLRGDSKFRLLRVEW